MRRKKMLASVAALLAVIMITFAVESATNLDLRGSIFNGFQKLLGADLATNDELVVWDTSANKPKNITAGELANAPRYHLTPSKPVFTDASKKLTSSGTLGVDQGGTGKTSVTANGPIVGGTTTTGAFQSVAPGNAGQVLTSAGANSPPTYQDPPAGTVPNGSAAGDILSWTGSAWSSGTGPSTWGMADEFWQDRPAGTVHNTLSTAKYPFLSRLRTVTDTESKLFISNGKLSFAGGKATPAWGDPGVWYGPVSREAGRILTGKVSPSSTGQDFAIGWHHSQSGTFANTSSRIYFTTSGRIYPLESITVGTYSVGDYQYAVVLRSSGSLVLVKGGAVYTNWTLVWVTAQGNISPLYPALLDYNGTFSADFLRIPSQFWLPSPLISDGFSGIDGALLSSRLTNGLGHAEGVAGGIGAGGSGGQWVGSASSLKAVDLVVNGGFDTDTTWGKTNGPTISSGVCSFVANAISPHRVTQTVTPAVPSLEYTLTYTVVSNNAAGLSNLYFVGDAVNKVTGANITLNTSPGTYSHNFTGNTAGDKNIVMFQANGPITSGALVIDNVSIKPVSANKAIITPSLGSEEQADPTFDDPTNWVTPDGWSVADGVATRSSPTVLAVLYNSTTPLSVVGNWYRVGATVTPTAGGYTLGDGSGNWYTSSGAVFRTIRAGTTNRMGITAQSSFTGTVDDIISKQLTLSSLFSSVTVSTPNIIASADLTRVVGTQVGLVVNLDSTSSPANFIIAYLDGAGNAKLEKCVDGTYTSLISAAVTYVADAKLVVIKDGQSYDLYYNNAKVGTTATVADAGIISNTKHGLFSTYEQNTFDNFVIRARGTEGQYAVLDEIGAN